MESSRRAAAHATPAASAAQPTLANSAANPPRRAPAQEPQFHGYIIKRCVLRAMDEDDRERELIAILFSCLHARGVLTQSQAADGFHSLLSALDDVSIDTPAAGPLLAHFLADAVLDGLLDRAALAPWPAEFASNLRATEALSEVERRLGGLHSAPNAQSASDEVQELRRKLTSVVEEYLCSHDVGEVRRRLRELQVLPQRHAAAPPARPLADSPVSESRHRREPPSRRRQFRPAPPLRRPGRPCAAPARAKPQP